MTRPSAVPSDRADQGRQRRHGEDVARADDDAREHVAAELVGAEPVLGGRRHQRVQHVVGEGIVRHDRRARRSRRPPRTARCTRPIRKVRRARTPARTRSRRSRAASESAAGAGLRSASLIRARRTRMRGLRQRVEQVGEQRRQGEDAPIVSTPACSIGKVLLAGGGEDQAADALVVEQRSRSRRGRRSDRRSGSRSR